MTPYATAFTRAVHFGLLTGVHLPREKAPVPDRVLQRLHDDESKHARDLAGFRQIDWVGGRLALRSAMRGIGRGREAVLADEHGAPTAPADVSASISHKRGLAVAIAARARHGRIGIDLEDLSPPRPGIADRVLRPEELEAVASLPPENQWTEVVLRFSFKEAIYKALNPELRRYIGFYEAQVTPDLDMTADIQLFLDGREGPFHLEGRYLWLDGRVLTMVRVRPPPQDPAPA